MTRDELFAVIDKTVLSTKKKQELKNAVDALVSASNGAKLPVSGWLHLTDEQTKILADLGSQFIYEGVNGELRITEFGILEIFHKYNELVGNHR